MVYNSITSQWIWLCVCGTSCSIHGHVALWEQRVCKCVCLLTHSQCPRAAPEQSDKQGTSTPRTHLKTSNIQSATGLYRHSNGHLAGALWCNTLWSTVEILDLNFESQRHSLRLAGNVPCLKGNGRNSLWSRGSGLMMNCKLIRRK